ncbi:hypothetical protein EYZ11_009120 [Aspergillus tanneri]|uniref:Uncharacterized protein n=1 Tax=Aspergillus tanneri TaxID=1220188 RepID=A0A4S3J8U9_9EURO|nr:hypothetical protein EYZ11_009120 [Aspergillus tanneri]
MEDGQSDEMDEVIFTLSPDKA